MIDAGDCQSIQALSAKLDDQAVGVWLRLGDDPGVWQCELRRGW
jgi:hypothetical protein